MLARGIRRPLLSAWPTKFRRTLSAGVLLRPEPVSLRIWCSKPNWRSAAPQLTDWRRRVRAAARGAKESFPAVQRGFHSARYLPLPRYPQISVVVACYNAERTLKPSLHSLQRLNCPDSEVILVDDG